MIKLPAFTRKRLLNELTCTLPGSQFRITGEKSVSRVLIDNQHLYEARGGNQDWRYRALLMLVREEKKRGEL